MHALIGPNDSGKSTFLRALQATAETALRSPQGPVSALAWGHMHATARGLPSGVKVHLGENFVYSLSRAGLSFQESLSAGRASARGEVHDPASSGIAEGHDEARMALAGARLLRFDPDALREASGLIPEGAAVGFLDERGKGLPGVYDAIMNRGDAGFQSIAKEVRRLFPTVKNLRLKARTSSTKELEVELVDGSRVPAALMSEGLLYFLAFAAVQHIESSSLLLVEEPENGLHPSRIADVVRVMRAMSEKGVQIILATHSPLVINEMKPEEVTVFTRDPKKGTKITPIAKTPDFEKRSKVYALGELWLAYADGDSEAALLKGGAA
jgi:energy-coupling factor transporter ATP-binding protein EcfA2